MVISGTAKKLFSTFDSSVVHRSLRLVERLSDTVSYGSMQGCMQADQSASTFFSFFFFF